MASMSFASFLTILRTTEKLSALNLQCLIFWKQVNTTLTYYNIYKLTRFLANSCLFRHPADVEKH